MSKTNLVLTELSYNRPYDVGLNQLLDLLKSPPQGRQYYPILTTFFTECSSDSITGFVEEQDISFDVLQETYKKTVEPTLSASNKREEWLKQQAKTMNGH